MNKSTHIFDHGTTVMIGTAPTRNLIRKWADPILQQVCREVDPGESVAELINLMREALRGEPTGVGLAAPQVGDTRRAIIVRQKTGGAYVWRVMINPEIVHKSTETKVGEEGCLSYPGVTKMIFRPTWIDLKYLDESRRPQRLSLSDFNARIAFHEIDHLNGVCLVGDENFTGAV